MNDKEIIKLQEMQAKIGEVATLLHTQLEGLEFSIVIDVSIGDTPGVACAGNVDLERSIILLEQGVKSVTKKYNERTIYEAPKTKGDA